MNSSLNNSLIISFTPDNKNHNIRFLCHLFPLLRIAPNVVDNLSRE